MMSVYETITLMIAFGMLIYSVVVFSSK
ncbi:putative holin-like toxin [Gracilibacillus salitolerans]